MTLVAMLCVSKQGISPYTVNALLGSILSGTFTGCEYRLIVDHTHVSGRNRAAAAALDGGFDYLMFLDSDMDWPVDALPRLKACGADIACTDMWGRGIPSVRIVSKGGLPVTDELAAGHEVEDIDACGMGCTLIHAQLLKRMKEKIGGPLWFQASSHSEDVSFCYLAKKLCGATIKCDFSMVAGHWGMIRNAGQDFTRDARNSAGKLVAPDVLRYAGATHLEER